MLQWESFRDQFTALVHNQPGLSDAQKLVHLQRALDGEAASVIKDTNPTDADYAGAWNALVVRYGNQRIPLCMRMKSLVELPPAASASAADIKRVVDFVKQSVRSFTTMGKPIEQWNEWLVFFLTSKLDVQTRIDWETSLQASSVVPPLSELLAFLENRLRAWQIISTDVFEPSGTQLQRADASATQSTRQRPKSVAAAFTKNTAAKCLFCAQNHQAFRCGRLLALDVAGRWDLIRNKKLCANCLRTGHFKTKCPSSGHCRNCGSQHHTTLHQEESQIHRGAHLSQGF